MPHSTQLPENRIRTLREARGMSQARLGELVSAHPATIQKIEAGEMQLTLRYMATIAAALGVTIPELLVLPHAAPAASTAPPAHAVTGTSEDVVEWKPIDGASVTIPSGIEVPGLVCVTGRVLDEIGIMPGDILVIDAGARACATIATGNVVVARQYSDETLGQYVQIVREYVEPSLLITNSSGANAVPLHIVRDRIAIKGVVRAVSRLMSLPAPGAPRPSPA